MPLITPRCAEKTFSVGIWACLLAVPCWWGPIRPKQLSTAANIQAHSFFKGFSTGLVPLTCEAIVPYFVAVSLQARMCNTVIFNILATFQKRNASTLRKNMLERTLLWASCVRLAFVQNSRVTADNNLCKLPTNHLDSFCSKVSLVYWKLLF